MTDDAGVVIVGASLAGMTAAEGLRSAGFSGSITLMGAEPHLPYSRPPLSKQVLLGSWPVERTQLHDADALDELALDSRFGQRVTGVDLERRTVTSSDSEVHYSNLVVATGVRARTHPHTNGLSGVHTLRTVDDARAVQQGLLHAQHIVVVGAGVLGCETASALTLAGHTVTLVNRSKDIRAIAPGGQLSSRLSELLTAHGVTVLHDAEVVEMMGSDQVSAIRLSSGSIIPADLVIVAIGSIPETDWMRHSDVNLDDGVLCDAHGRVAPLVYAIGDVARWHDPMTGEAHRVEHQATAIEQALAVAQLIVTGEESAPIAPFFWSELFGQKVLVHGRLDPDLALTTLAGDIDGDGFVAATVRDGRTTGLVGWNMPREFRAHRAALMKLTPSLANT